MSAKSYKMTDDLSENAVVDLGGDDRGALALGRFREKILLENNYNALLVVNPYRPETRDIDGVLSIKNEIEAVSGIPFNGIVNNANLGLETTEKEIIYGQEFCQRIRDKIKLDIAFTVVRFDLVSDNLKTKIPNILPLTPIEYKIW